MIEGWVTGIMTLVIWSFWFLKGQIIFISYYNYYLLKIEVSDENDLGLYHIESILESV